MLPVSPSALEDKKKKKIKRIAQLYVLAQENESSGNEYKFGYYDELLKNRNLKLKFRVCPHLAQEILSAQSLGYISTDINA